MSVIALQAPKNEKLYHLATYGDTTIIAKFVNDCIAEFGVSMKIDFREDRYFVSIDSKEQIPNPRAAATLLIAGLEKMRLFSMEELAFKASDQNGVAYWQDEYHYNEEWKSWQSKTIKEQTEFTPFWVGIYRWFSGVFKISKKLL